MTVINGLGTGGAERSLSEMLPVLKDSGVEAGLVCLKRRSEGVEQSVLESGRSVRFLSGQTFTGRVLEMRRVLRAERPDLIHTTLFDSNVVGRLAAAGTRIPVLTSIVNTPYSKARAVDPNLNRFKLMSVRAIDVLTSRLTTHFHAITSTVKDDAVATLGIRPDQVTVIPRGRDPERLGRPSAQRRLQARKALHLSSDSPVLITVGRQEHQKGHRYMLEAMPRILERWPGAIVLLVGRRGNATPDLERIASGLNLGDSVRFLGHRDDVPELLAAADVFVFPSLWEGLGGALIEAMALGLPIVASRLEVFQEVVEERGNALLVSSGSPFELVTALDALLSDEAIRVRFGDRSRDIFEERFTLESSAREMIDLYRRVAALGKNNAKPKPCGVKLVGRLRSIRR